jgi:hypothetical protein
LIVVSLIQLPSSHLSHILVVNNIHVVVGFLFCFCTKKRAMDWCTTSPAASMAMEYHEQQVVFFSLFHLSLCFLNYENFLLPKNVWDDR